ncbi:hypothetical protein ACOMHN_066549 [Nucella lapillus]
MVKSQVGSFVESNPQLTVKGVGAGQPRRVMAKLMKEAERVKKVLSANTEHRAQVEGLLDGEDFSCKSYLLAVPGAGAGPSHLTCRRRPQGFRNHLGRMELGKSINTDLAAAWGCLSGGLPKGFKVKTFHVRRDANTSPSTKVMTFNKHYIKDFSFDVRYGELDFLSEEERR